MTWDAHLKRYAPFEKFLYHRHDIQVPYAANNLDDCCRGPENDEEPVFMDIMRNENVIDGLSSKDAYIDILRETVDIRGRLIDIIQSRRDVSHPCASGQIAKEGRQGFLHFP